MLLKELKMIPYVKPIIVLAISFAATASAQVINSQNDSLNCALLSSNIYCFTGDSSSLNTGIGITMLKLKNNDGKNTKYLNSQWSTINSNPNNVSLENRISFQALALPTGTQMLISGGYNLNRNNSLADQTIIYDSERNIWSKGQNFIDGSASNRQIFAASSVYIPSKGVAFFGGQEEHASSSINPGTNASSPGTNASIPFIDNGLTRIAGYSQLTLYDPQNNVWSVPTPQSKLPTVHSFHQTSIYDPKSKNVYFFGGYYYDTASPTFNVNSPLKHSFSYAIMFNLLTGEWGTQNLTGENKPTSRAFHTTTLLPAADRSVLLYGGSDGVTQSPDYCYTLDLFTKEWSQQRIYTSSLVTLTRSHHAAVVANDNQLFIISNSASSDNRLIILDITLPASISLSDTFTIISNGGDSYGGAAMESSSSKTETIAAAVSSVVAFLACVGAILFCFLRRRKARAARLAKEEQHDARQVQLEQINVQQPNFSEPPPPYIPPRPFPPQNKKIREEEEQDLNWSNFNNVKSKYLSDNDDSTSQSEKKLPLPGNYSNEKASSSRAENFDFSVGQDIKSSPSLGEPSYSTSKPNEFSDKKPQ